MVLKQLLIARNASILLITDVISKILQTVLSIIIAHRLGASDLGLLAFAVSFSAMFSFIPNFGFMNFISREVAKYPEKSGSYFINLVVIKLVLSLITFLIIFIGSQFMAVPHEQLMLVYLAALIMLMDSFILFYTAFFRGFQKAEYEALILISENFLIAATGILIISLGYGLLFMMIVRVLVVIAIFVAGFMVLKIRFIPPSHKIDLNSCHHLIKSAAPFTFLAALVIVNAQIGTVLLTQLKGTLYTGWYSAALKLCGIFQFIPASVAGAILPGMTRYARDSDRGNLIKTFCKSFKYLLILMLPIATGISILADKVILFIYNEDFINSILTLRILIWLIVLSFSNSIFNVAFASINREKIFVHIQVIGTITNVLLNLWLIPIFGQNGVAIATISSQFVVFIFAAFYVSKYYGTIKYSSIWFKPAIASLIMLASITLTRSHHLILVILLAMVIYAGLLFLLKVFDNEEITFLKTGLSKFCHVFNQHNA